jgi:two-component system sensor histidine kinase FlrB
MSERPRTGLRREAAIFMPAALIVLVALSVVPMLLYRGAILRQIELSREASVSTAQRLATVLREDPGTDLGRLRATLPSGMTIALLDADGNVIAGEAGLTAAGIRTPPSGGASDQTRIFGPGDGVGTAVVVTTPVETAAAGARLLLVQAIPHLAAERQRLRILMPLVLGVDAILAIMVLAFFRYALQPYGAMLRRARSAGVGEESRDEVAFLIETFDRAVSALTAPLEIDETTQIRALQETLGEGAEGALLLLDAEGVLLAASPAAEKLLDLHLVPGAPIAEALEPQAELAHSIRLALDQGSSVPTAEVRLRRGDEIRVAGLTVQSLRRPDGETRGFLVLFADLTEARRQAAQERLAQSLAQLGELSAGVAHELRNSLGTLSGYLELIERHKEEPPSPEYLRALHGEYRHLQRVVSDFLAFARPGTARPESVELCELVRELLAAPDFDAAAIETDLPAERPATIHADRQLLMRALHNLLDNAVLAHPADAGEPIRLTLRRDGRGWLLHIADRGPGVPEDVRDRLFQPFVTGRSHGTGLGLSLAQRIIGLHGGELRLLDRPGGGTVAEVELPTVNLV